jgi:flagellar protein FlaG
MQILLLQSRMAIALVIVGKIDYNTWRCIIMALDGISNALYPDSAQSAQKSKAELPIQGVSAKNINITETPAVVQDNNQKDKKQIIDAINKANDKMRIHRTKIEFSYHEEINRVSIKVLDQDTEEVIREIPPEETLKMVQKMWELAGLLVDEKR